MAVGALARPHGIRHLCRHIRCTAFDRRSVWLAVPIATASGRGTKRSPPAISVSSAPRLAPARSPTSVSTTATACGTRTHREATAPPRPPLPSSIAIARHAAGTASPSRQRPKHGPILQPRCATDRSSAPSRRNVPVRGATCSPRSSADDRPSRPDTRRVGSASGSAGRPSKTSRLSYSIPTMP